MQRCLPRTQRRERALAALAEFVQGAWTEEAKIRGCATTDPMPVHSTLKPDVSDHARHIFPGRVIFDGTSDQIDELTEQFLRLSRRRLVILGEPGSGKTTLAVQLLLRLLEVRTPAEQVPVLLTSYSWNTATHPRLQDCLAFRLGKDYPALRAIDETMPKKFDDNRMVLPVITRRPTVDCRAAGNPRDSTVAGVSSRATARAARHALVAPTRLRPVQDHDNAVRTDIRADIRPDSRVGIRANAQTIPARGSARGRAGGRAGGRAEDMQDTRARHASCGSADAMASRLAYGERAGACGGARARARAEGPADQRVAARAGERDQLGPRGGKVREIAGNRRSIADPYLDLPRLPQPDDPERPDGRDRARAGGRTLLGEDPGNTDNQGVSGAEGRSAGLARGRASDWACPGACLDRIRRDITIAGVPGKLPWRIMSFLDDAHPLVCCALPRPSINPDMPNCKTISQNPRDRRRHRARHSQKTRRPLRSDAADAPPASVDRAGSGRLTRRRIVGFSNPTRRIGCGADRSGRARCAPRRGGCYPGSAPPAPSAARLSPARGSPSSKR